MVHENLFVQEFSAQIVLNLTSRLANGRVVLSRLDLCFLYIIRG